MKSQYFVELAKQKKLPKDFSDQFGADPNKFFIAVPELREKYGTKFKNIPLPAIGLYTYLTDRIGVGLKQLMAGARKWKLDLLDRSDLATLNKTASEVTGIPMINEVEADLFEQILLG